MESLGLSLRPGCTWTIPARAPEPPVLPRLPGMYQAPASIAWNTVPTGWDGERGFAALFPPMEARARVRERHCFGSPDVLPNRLIEGDNLLVLRALPDASLDLIAIDPPFFSGRGYRGQAGAFSDVWQAGMPGYLAWLNARLWEMRRLLRPAGSIYLHLDWHAVHYVKVEMDRLFGPDCFLNDIAWLYGLGGSSARSWPRKHDRILWYSRTPDGQHFMPPLVPATSQRMRGQLKKAPDYWDIPTLNNMAAERSGYPTQKPAALLERIIASSCPPGGTVADFFCGSGTAAVVAQRLGRHWLACDVSAEAAGVTERRLLAEGGTLPEGTPDFTVEAWAALGASAGPSCSTAS